MRTSAIADLPILLCEGLLYPFLPSAQSPVCAAFISGFPISTLVPTRAESPGHRRRDLPRLFQSGGTFNYPALFMLTIAAVFRVLSIGLGVHRHDFLSRRTLSQRQRRNRERSARLSRRQSSLRARRTALAAAALLARVSARS